MKKRKRILSIVVLFIVGSIILGFVYIPKKPYDSSSDIAATGDYIIEYICNYDPSYNIMLNETIESIAMVSPRTQQDEVVVAIVDCTFWKKQMFRKKIANSKYVRFENWDSYAVND